MGAWGHGNFDNDAAGDWGYALEERDDLSFVQETIDAVFAEAYIDADVACEAIAAIEVVARLKGQSGTSNAYTEAVDNWVKAHPVEVSAELIDQSTRALALLQGESSELAELWAESDDEDAWRQEIDALSARLKV
ncbi:MAG: DUF4259 domain-containing protein [Woeseiaceae bacterium]